MREKILREVLLERGEAVKARLKAEAETQAHAQTQGEGEAVGGKRIPTETFLSGSFYGRFFLRRVGLAMYRKDIWKWKDWAKALPAVPLANRLGSTTGDGEDALLDAEDGDEEGEGGRNGAKKSKKVKKMRKDRTKEEKELEDILAGV